MATSDSINESSKSPVAGHNANKGLTQKEAEMKLAEFGSNEITEKKKSGIKRFLSKFYGPVPIVLWIIIALSYLLKNMANMYIILILLIFNAVVSFAEEYKADKSIELLKSMLSINSRVRRDGIWKIMPSRLLVPGDLIRIRSGDIVPADAQIVSDSAVEIDQSVITGESLPVTKKNMDGIYSGSIVKAGEATCVVSATGYNTAYGKTAELVEIAGTKSQLEEEILSIIKYLIIIDVAVIFVLLIYGFFSVHLGLGTLALFLLVLFAASVPIALPAAFTISLALGTEKLAKKSILVTKLSSMEETATMNLLCLDKTGTITENKLKVKGAYSTKYPERDIFKYAAEASRAEDKDPIDMAVLDKASELMINTGKQQSFVPFDPSTRMTSAIISGKSGEYGAAKGSFQVIAKLCRLKSHENSKYEKMLESFSKDGYRTIAVARKKPRWQIIGIIAIYDKPRKESKSLIEELRSLGIKIKMITGDNAEVAGEISGEVGLGGDVISFSSIPNKRYDALDRKSTNNIIRAGVLAGVYPKDKYSIIKILQKNGYRVGMTGDGVNDAPALKQASVGIAVNNATDVAKSAATLVLTKSGIGVIVEAVKESRRIFERMLTYTIVKVAKVVQIVFFIAIVFFAYGFVPISAFLLILLMLTNDIMNISLATDNVRYSQHPDLWSMKKIFGISIVLGIVLILEALLIVPVSFAMNLNALQFATAAFLLLNISDKFTIFNAREKGWFFKSAPSKPIVISSIAGISIGILFAYYGIFMAAISVQSIILILAICAVFFIVADVLKLLAMRIFEAKHMV